MDKDLSSTAKTIDKTGVETGTRCIHTNEEKDNKSESVSE